MILPSIRPGTLLRRQKSCDFPLTGAGKQHFCPLTSIPRNACPLAAATHAHTDWQQFAKKNELIILLISGLFAGLLTLKPLGML